MTLDDSEGEDEAGHLLPLESEHHSGINEVGGSYSAFPRAKPGTLTIHTDTCVALKINRGHVTICSGPSPDHPNFVFVAQVDALTLKTAVGLEKDPEICLLYLGIQDGKVLFGSGR